MEVGDSPAERALSQLTEKELLKLDKMFRICHALAVNNRPYTGFVWHCQLLKAMGTKVVETYLNDKMAKSFTESISLIERQKLHSEIVNSKFLTVLCDGSTDSAVIDNEIVYLRLVNKGIPSTIFAGCMQVRKADAPGILDAIKRATMRLNLDWDDLCSKIVALGSDGASVMVGVRRGVAVLLRESNPSIISIHCFAHRLELAFKDVILKIPIADQLLNTLLMGLFYFYNKSPLNKSNLKASFKVLSIKLVLPTRVGGTRWIAHILLALTNLFRGYRAITQHLQQMIANKSHMAVAENKAKGLLKLLHNQNVMMFAALMHDVASCLVVMSKTFQKEHGTASDIHRVFESTLGVLKDYKTRDGPYLSKKNKVGGWSMLKT